MNELPRRLEPITRQALDDFRVVAVTGPRQAGKTTLVRRVLGGSGTFARLDRVATLQAALTDPDGFAAFGETPRAFDEVQRAGDPLIRAIKHVVDDDPSRGQFLLNGSADFLTVPTISESLAGRAVFLELWPFTQGELHQTPDGFIEAAFSDHNRLLEGGASPLGTSDYLERACAGGFPEAVFLSPPARHTWFRDYLRTVIQRDIKDLSSARRTQDLPKLLRLLAARTAGELVMKNLHEDAGFGSSHTTEAYLGYLQMTYLVLLLPAWSRNLTSKAARRPKVHITDSGLAAHLLGKSPQALARPTDPARGQIVESFAVNEMHRQASWHRGVVTLHHFRDRGGLEIDVVAEAADGRLVAVEIKSGPTVDRSDARHLRWLRDKAPEDFVCGVVLHTGGRAYRLDDRILALPISRLWTAS
ncbi:MAG: ATP-binding protein [Acidimicrobiaceae bacterium]|nr:ATP-binding protein [Acidimicrobiaceae bacterium]MYE97403.1 ATP-binding protein [Acidimicrobiaceae bacterium]MYI55343.1 ATP-binding protein [Acidimicrobiaceae bacterium]